MTATCRSIVSVEDSDTDFMALQAALLAAGLTNPIERCASGQVAMAALLPDDDTPLTERASLIVLDLNLPGVDGRKLLRAFRARDPGRTVPVIVLSTSTHPRDIEDSYRAGADAYLVKPLDLEDWEQKIGPLADFWLRAAEQALASDGKHAFGGVAPARLAEAVEVNEDGLSRTIECQIIPRLLLAHSASDASAEARPDFLPCPDDVEELARLVMAHDPAVGRAYLQAMRSQGATIEVILLGLVAPASRLVGEIWKAEQCSFDEFATALRRLQHLLVDLSPTAVPRTRH